MGLALMLTHWRTVAVAAALLGVLAWGWLGHRDAARAWAARDHALTEAAQRAIERDKARAERAAALDAAQTCSDSVQALKAEADKRHADATPARHQAASQARQHQQRAADILAAPASNADDAQAARERAWDWLDNRVGR
jgi:hypothetical protein